MKKYSFLILLIIYSNLFAQTEHKSILYLESESKQLIENSSLLSDSIYSENIFKEQHSVGNILAQTLIGSIFSLGAGFISLGISYGIAYSSNNATFSATAFYMLVPT
ncbi:MAG: hypothetical protein IIB83_02230, partial [Bacteroidetes bacterium]|nr:hypothetical protein [Bacteroidota bacterium]